MTCIGCMATQFNTKHDGWQRLKGSRCRIDRQMNETPYRQHEINEMLVKTQVDEDSRKTQSYLVESALMKYNFLAGRPWGVTVVSVENPPGETPPLPTPPPGQTNAWSIGVWLPANWAVTDVAVGRLRRAHRTTRSRSYYGHHWSIIDASTAKHNNVQSSS